MPPVTTLLEFVAIFFILAGGWLQDEGRARARRNLWFRRDAVWTTGTVVRVDRIVKRGKLRFVTVFEYTTEEGRVYTVVSKELTATPEFEPGALVTVGYEPTLPEEAILNNALGAPELHPWEWVGWGWLTFLVGCALFLLALRLKA
jgi:hypothetical protein